MYLDLLDDGLYQSAGTSDRAMQALKNHLRTAAFIHLVFGRGPLVVPEQWAVSSAAGVDVLSEIAAGYLRHIEDAQYKTEAPPPILFTCFERDQDVVGRVRPEQWLPAALWERAARRRRLRTSAHIDTEHGGNERTWREPLAALMRNALHESSDTDFTGQFKRDLGETLRDPGRAAGLATLFAYAQKVAPHQRLSADYSALLQDYAERVLASLQSETAPPLGAKLRDTLIEAKNRGIPLHHYVPILQLWREQNAEDDLRYLHVMRFGMHVALSDWANSNGFVSAYHVYEGGDAEEATDLLSSIGIHAVAASPSPRLEKRAVYEVVIERARIGGLGECDFWEDIWRTVFNLMQTPRFRGLRRDLYRAASESVLVYREPASLDDLIAVLHEHISAFALNRTMPGVSVHVRESHAGGALDIASGGISVVKEFAPEMLGGLAGPVGGGIAALRVAEKIKNIVNGDEKRRNAPLFTQKRKRR